MSEEIFEVVNEEGEVIGSATRSECHSNPALIHQAVHVLVVNEEGNLFLQKRSMAKDIQPGKWDTSVGGHMQPGENPEEAAQREMHEELGVEAQHLEFAYQYIWRSDRETELVRTYVTSHQGPFNLQEDELDDGKFWAIDEIRKDLGKGTFTPNFEVELRTFTEWLSE